MSDNILIDDFKRNWTFFMKKVSNGYPGEFLQSRFDCSSFSCRGCNDWLDGDNENRNFNNQIIENTFFSFGLLKIQKCFQTKFARSYWRGWLCKSIQGKLPWASCRNEVYPT